MLLLCGFVDLSTLLSDHRRTSGMRHLIPFIYLLITTSIPSQLSNITNVRISIILFLLISSIELASYHRIRFHRMLGIYVFFCLAFLTVAYTTEKLPLLLLSSVHFGVTVLYSFINIKYVKSKNAFEISLLAFVSTVIYIFQKSVPNYFFGSLVFLIYLVFHVYFLYRNEQLSRKTFADRLYDLENKFTKKVEKETLRRTESINQQVEIMKSQVKKDPLTGIYNRSGIEEKVQEFIENASVKVFSLAIFDLDGFKGINDTFGHIQGDETLKYLASTVTSKLRQSDIFARLGGDEFILVMPKIEVHQAVIIIERIRSFIAENSNPKITLSVGMAQYPQDGTSFLELYKRADTNLYTSKENGKDRIYYHQPHTRFE